MILVERGWVGFFELGLLLMVDGSDLILVLSSAFGFLTFFSFLASLLLAFCLAGGNKSAESSRQ